MTFARFEHLLERTMGLNAASIGVSAIERAVRARLRACKLEDTDDYWQQLQRSPEELQELVEAVVVPETWFFRDPQAFMAMVQIVTKQWLPAHPSGVLRLLSLPCSTGEEAYTMAMALIDAGLPRDRFRIDAIDISGQALARARRGIYGSNSFRGQDLAFRDRHFERLERGCRIGEGVRGPVRFVQGNLLDEDFLRGAEAYDIVFCRNLLIYFDGDTQKRAIEVLKRLLSPQGMLFVGHSEAGLMLGHGLASAKMPMAFAFHKAAKVLNQPKKEAVPARAAFQGKVIAPGTAPQRPRSSAAFKSEQLSPAPTPALDELRRIADRGLLADAARGCETYMRERGPSPDALLLLGLISDASGDLPAAARYYRKALYLEPDHSEALGHLALLMKKQGDAAGAKVLGDRMRRLDQRRAG
jgi:chemotaxis protein methyltransferase WspC